MARIGSVCTGPLEGEGQGRGSPGNRGGGVRKANEERAGSESSNRVGSGRNWENYITVPNILQWKRDLRDEAKKKRAGNAKHRRQEDWTLPFPLLAFRKITIYTVVFIGRQV